MFRCRKRHAMAGQKTQSKEVKPEEISTEDRRQIPIRYEKGSFYRVAAADGALLNVNPGGRIDIDFWYEKNPLPDYDLIELEPDGTYSRMTERKVEEGSIRHVEVGISMDYSAAKRFSILLRKVTDQIEKLLNLEESE